MYLSHPADSLPLSREVIAAHDFWIEFLLNFIFLHTTAKCSHKEFFMLEVKLKAYSHST